MRSQNSDTGTEARDFRAVGEMVGGAFGRAFFECRFEEEGSMTTRGRFEGGGDAGRDERSLEEDFGEMGVAAISSKKRVFGSSGKEGMRDAMLLDGSPSASAAASMAVPLHGGGTSVWKYGWEYVQGNAPFDNPSVDSPSMRRASLEEYPGRI